MDQAINIPLSKILFNSKENIQLYSEKISSSTHFEQVQETNFHVQYKKNYGIKNREECLYEDLSKIQKQLALLSNISNSNSYKYNSSVNCSQKYCQKMLPKNLHSINSNQKDQSSIEDGNKCQVIDKNENQKESDHNNDVHVNNSSPSASEQLKFLNNKPDFHQLTDTPQLVFSLNKLPDNNKTKERPSCENVSSIISFTKSEPRKTCGNGCDYYNNEKSQDENGNQEREDKLLKCRHLNYTAFEFEGDYSKDLDSSGLFEFSLEGEKIVSSLCGPQTKTLNKENDEKSESNTLFLYNTPDQEFDCYEQFKRKSSPYKNNNSTLSKFLNAEMSFSSAVTSTPEKDTLDSIQKQDVIYSEMKPVNKSCEQITEVDKTTIEKENRFAGGDKLTIDNNPNEMKCVILQQMSTNCVEMRSGASYGTWMIGRIRPLENKECKGTKFEFCNQFNDSFQIENVGNSSFKNNQQKVKSDDINKSNKSASVPNIFSMLNKFNQGDNSTIISQSDSVIQNAETKSEILDICDDEISFRKSAIKGCLVFERIIKDLHIVTQEQDLENYCKTVKRYVSVASSSEKREFTVIISELISGFLKLADSWGILNSYFGESGNFEYKPQNLDDIKFYQSFQDWQVKSRILLDHLTVVVQNLKEFIPKVDEKEKLFKESQISKLSEYNPFLDSIQSKSRGINSINKNESNNSSTTQMQQKEENSKSQTATPLLQDIQFPKNLANIFTAHNQNNNWKQNISENNVKKPPEAFWELPQNNQQQNVFSPPSVCERKLRKKWSLTMPEFQSDSQCPAVPNQGITVQQNHGTAQMPPINFQYVAQNKGPMENIMMQPFNFFGNQYSPLPHNIQNIRENTSYTYGRPPTYYPNMKQSPKKKSTISFKPEEHFHKEIMNNNPVYNRVNMCNPQMAIPLLQNNVNPNPFGMMEEAKSNVIYPNFCIAEGKTIATNTPYGANFFHNEVYPPNSIPNQNMFCHKTIDPKPMMSLPLNTGDGDDSSEEYYPIKSYMKPGSYRVPNKSKSLVLQTTNNLNYIFDDVLVTGITVPFTKTNIFSQSKKITNNKTVSTIEKSIQTNRSDEVKNTDLVWKAALASAEVLGKSLICKQDEKNHIDKVNANFQTKDVIKLKEPVSSQETKISNKLAEGNQVFQSSLTDETNDNKNKEDKRIDLDTTKPTAIKTDDWLIQSFSKLEGQLETKDFPGIESDKSNEVENASNKTYDSKANSSNTTKNESDDSDNTTNDIDSEFYTGKERGTNPKKDKNIAMKQKLSSNLKSVSILQKPREYCQSRGKPWEKARDFTYQIPLHKGDTRNIHKNPANWIKYNRKCINRQTLYKLQDILNNLSKMESNNQEMQKESGSRNETASRIININAINYKLKSHIYENIDQILIDIRQMFVNSRETNKESNNTTELTTKLEIFFNELVEKHFGKPDAMDNRENSNQSGSSLAMKNRRTQKVQRKMN